MIRSICLALALLVASATSDAQDHQHHSGEVIAGVVGKFYSTWMRPDKPAVSCCNLQDCEPVSHASYSNGRWKARRKSDGAWLAIPPEKIERNRDSPDGRSHMCSKGDAVFCFIVGSGS